MSIVIRSAASAVVALSFVAMSATPAVSSRHHGCAALTVTIARVADIPSGVSVRALQEGRGYPPRCR